MKIFPVDKIREADAYTIENEPILSIDLMERASRQLFIWIKNHVEKSKKIIVFAGLGNNGGDGLALGRMLAESGYNVSINIIRYSDKQSDDFSINLQRLDSVAEININNIDNADFIPEINENDVVVDAIFGSGLQRPITGLIGKAVNQINQSDAIVISVDIPSGLFADNSSNKKGEIVNADYTLSFQFPKLSFLFPENEMLTGNWEVLDIGLSRDFIDNEPCNNYLLSGNDIKPLVKGRSRFSHKGTFGHALIIAGSHGKMGAAVLASKACLKSGVGLLHTHVPVTGINILQTSTPETMISIDGNEKFFTKVPELGIFNSVGIGPGLGMEHKTQMALKLLIQNTTVPIVFDADAINILAENPTWLAFLPKGSILTPHPKEFQRLVGGWNSDSEKFEKLKNLSQKHRIYIVLKGAFTCTCFPDGKFYFNSTGNPGMATAGSGDVLTGIITGLLASGYNPGTASVLGVYLHGLSGDISARKNGMEALIASDLIENLGKAFRKLNKHY